MTLLAALPAEKREALRRMAETAGVDEDTAALAWAAWQALQTVPREQRTGAIGIFLTLEHIGRNAAGEPALFKEAVVRQVVP